MNELGVSFWKDSISQLSEKKSFLYSFLPITETTYVQSFVFGLFAIVSTYSILNEFKMENLI